MDRWRDEGQRTVAACALRVGRTPNCQQALSIAFATRSQMDEDYACELIELVAVYPGVTGRRMTPESANRISDRALEIMMRLARMKPGFVER